MFAEGIRADPNKQIVLSYVGFLSFENHKICPCFFWHLGASRGGGRGINSGLFNHPHPSEREINHPKQEDLINSLVPGIALTKNVFTKFKLLHRPSTNKCIIISDLTTFGVYVSNTALGNLFRAN